VSDLGFQATLLYPCLLALLCVGAGLLVDRLSGRFLDAMLLPAVGAATLIAVSQLTTYSVFAAQATPYLLALLAAAGFALGWQRVRTFAQRWRRCAWQLAVPVLAFLAALAPVLFAGRPSFSSYGVLTDSAFHMLGAGFLIHHGQDYSHLDLRNSYGQYINSYYNASYPSGADTLFGGSALLSGVPLIWAFQPFNAFMLAIAAGPAWVLARHVGLHGALAALAALSITLPALVYGYELIASVKEITALAMILTLGALVTAHSRWLGGPAPGAAPFALVSSAGVSALGVAFGAWVLTAVLVLAVIATVQIRASRQSARQPFLLIAVGGVIGLIAALNTWINVSGSLKVAQNIATTTNPGNLQKPLRTVQIFGTWLVGSYKHVPTGGLLEISYVLAAVAFLAAVLGALYLVYTRRYALGGWIVLTLAVALALTAYGTTWATGKTLMLTSPVILLLAWAGVAALRARTALPPVLRPAALLLALTLVGAVATSDAMQYHASNLAPTARYQELSQIGSRFAGRGPALFTDYDEYALYSLRDLDVGGPDFMIPPAAIVLPHGLPVDLNRIAPTALRSYPLIVTRRNPAAVRPPSAYSLLWQGTYYQVWGRHPNTPAALAHLGLSPALPVQCARVESLAQLAKSHSAQLVSASPPELVHVNVASALHPGWANTRLGLLMARSGHLESTFALPRAGEWELWLQGEIMPAVHVSVDGHPLASISAQLTGVASDPDTMAPLPIHLPAGHHRLSITRAHSSPLAPGDGGSAILDAIFLTPAGTSEEAMLHVTPAAQWRSLCGHRFEWIEVVNGPAAAPDPAPGPISVSIDRLHPGPRVPREFLGLSFELSSAGQIAAYSDRGDFATLLRSLGGGVLRFGGASADTRVAWTDRRTPRPAWASSVLDVADLRRLARLAARSGWRVLLTINLAHYDPSAAAREAAAAKRTLGPWLAGIEVGNEPDSYARHNLRAAPWTPSAYQTQVSAYRRAIASRAPGIPLAGPGVSGSRAFQRWGPAETRRQHPALLTGHHYPLRCNTIPPPTIEALLSRTTRENEAQSLARFLAVAHASATPFRMDETNTVSCGGTAGISNTFASALWAVDYTAHAMTAGLSGINFQGNPANCNGYSPLCATSPRRLAAGALRAQPEWYALLLSKELTGDRPLHLTASPAAANVDVIALLSPQGKLHIVIVDDDPPSALPVTIRVHVGRGFQGATALPLTASAPDATAGVRLGGAAVAGDGSWHEPAHLQSSPNRAGVLTLDVQPSSAMLVTVRPK